MVVPVGPIKTKRNYGFPACALLYSPNKYIDDGFFYFTFETFYHEFGLEDCR